MPYAGIGPDKKAQQFSGRVLTYLGVVYDLRPECAVYVAWWFKTPKDDPKTIVTAEKFQIGAGLSGYVAELTAAFVLAELNITPTVRHADYIGSWISLLKEDKRAVFTAARLASQAAEYILAFQSNDSCLAAPFSRMAA